MAFAVYICIIILTPQRLSTNIKLNEKQDPYHHRPDCLHINSNILLLIAQKQNRMSNECGKSNAGFTGC